MILALEEQATATSRVTTVSRYYASTGFNRVPAGSALALTKAKIGLRFGLGKTSIMNELNF